jgi:hypothetical protein
MSLVDVLAAGDDQFAGLRVVHIVHGGAAEDTIVEALHDLFVLLQRGGHKTT